MVDKTGLHILNELKNIPKQFKEQLEQEFQNKQQDNKGK